MEIKYTFNFNISGRKAQAICSEIAKHNYTILFTKDERTVNGASLLGLLSLNILAGDTVKIRVVLHSEEEREGASALLIYLVDNLF